MPRPMSLDHVCRPRAMMACRARRCSTVCAAQRRCLHATPDVVRLCVLPKGDDGMPRPTSFDSVCFPKAMMACHARRCLTVCAVRRRRCHAMLDVTDSVCFPRAVMSYHARHYRPCVLSKGGDVLPRPMLPSMCAVQERRCHATHDFAERVCCPRAVISCHARRCRPCV